MRYYEIIYNSIEYIEKNLKNKISVQDMASHCGFSKFHYTRVFTKITGSSPYDYYIGRKITETVYYMCREETKIIDAAYEYQYSSPESFGRACMKVFGKSPSVIRKEAASGVFVGIEPIAKEYLCFLEKKESVKIRLVSMDGLTLSGISYIGQAQDDYFKMPDALEAFVEGISMKGKSVYKVNLHVDAVNYLRFIGYIKEEEEEVRNLLIKNIPEMTYLVIDTLNHIEDMDLLLKYIHTIYLPNKNMIPKGGYELESISSEGRYYYIPVE